MAVTIDSVSAGSTTNSVASKTWTHTSAGTNRAIVVAVEWNQPSDTETITSVTYDGTTLTQLGTNVVAGSSGLDRCVALYQLKAQTTGAKSIVVTMSTSLAFFASAVSFNGVDQTSPFGALASATTTPAASTATLSTTLAASVSSMVLSAVAIRATTTTTTPATQEWNALVGTNNRFAGAVQPGASSVTSTYTWTTPDNAALLAVEIKASSSQTLQARASITGGSHISSLTDDFSTQSTVKWRAQGGGAWPTGITATAGQLQIVTSSAYPTLESAATWDLRNDAAFVQVVTLPSQAADNSTEMGFGVHLDPDNYFEVLINGSANIVWRTTNAGVEGTSGYTAYNATSMKWLRWRNSGSNVYLETAPNVSGPWSILGTYAVTFPISAVRPYFYSGVYGTVASPGTAAFDNFNVGTTKTLQARARIKRQLTKALTARARIAKTGSFAIGGLGFAGPPTRQLSAHARIIAPVVRSLAARARVTITPAIVDQSIRPDVSPDAEELYAKLGPYSTEDAHYGWALLRFCDAICTGIQYTDDLVRDSDDGVGWSAVMDIDRAPDEALPWLAQFVGVDTINNLSPDQQRIRIRETSGFRRGSVSAIQGAARPYLTGNRTVIVSERDTSPYHLTVTTYQAETPDPDAVAAALLAEKPAGLVLAYVVSSGATYDQLAATGMTYDDLSAAYATYDVMKLTILS